MELLALLLGLVVAAGAVIAWSARANSYRVRNRDVPPPETSSARERSELDISKMLD